MVGHGQLVSLWECFAGSSQAKMKALCHYRVRNPYFMTLSRVFTHLSPSCTVNCWPTPTGGGTTEVNIEYELESDRLKLHDLTISIPLPDGFPKVGSHTGSYSVDPNTNALVWSIPLVSSDTDKSGSMEFTIDGEDTTAFFPVKVDFVAEGSLVGVGIEGVTNADGSETLVFSQEVTCTTDEYTIVE